MIILQNLIFLLPLSAVAGLVHGGQTPSREAYFTRGENRQSVIERSTVEDEPTPTQIDSIPNELWKSFINSRIYTQDLIHLSQSSKNLYKETSEEREVWSGIYRACSPAIASSLSRWNDRRVLYTSLSMSVEPWDFLMMEVPSKECMASWRSLCSFGFSVPLNIRKVKALRPEIMTILPSCFEVNQFIYHINGEKYLQYDGEESWDHLMQWITPSSGPLLSSQKIRSLSIYNFTTKSLSRDEEDLFLKFLRNERTFLESFTSAGLVFSTMFARGWAQILQLQQGPKYWHLNYYLDEENPDFLPIMLNGLKRNKSLKKLSIAFSQLSQRSLRALADMMSENQGLEELSVVENLFGRHHQELKDLVRASLGHPRLKVLDLSLNSIPYDTIFCLKRMVSNSKSSIKFLFRKRNTRLAPSRYD